MKAKADQGHTGGVFKFKTDDIEATADGKILVRTRLDRRTWVKQRGRTGEKTDVLNGVEISC